uniref:Putative ribonuclease H-like domain-containing protein n=1 Tax=Tanacetum cinerariifolium TaxID=118510 RepID=A0A699IIP5_TANCI|nr:putative ribonuclease H-like domain-containing protein [Tanacetum cinerariifolium]
MIDPECVKKKIKIAPHDYSKENYLATLTPHKQLTPEQIFWSKDLIKMKAEPLKKQTPASRPIKALMVYPPNTPATLVPRVLLTKSQVKINIFALIQLFSKFEKTCKKRITPTGLTEGERGFEQTKECYLTEVILFFKILKDHFEGIQKALTKEIKKIKEIFKELEAEVDQHVINRKHDEIEWKNLLIANDNLTADCLSKEVFYIATNSELTISRFTEMHDAHTVVQACFLELEAWLSKLNDKIQKDDHNELVKRFSILKGLRFSNHPINEKVTVLQEQNELFRVKNAKIKQHYNIQIARAKHIDQTIALLTENKNLKVQINEKQKCVTLGSVKPEVLAPGDRSQLRNFMKKFTRTVRFGNDHFGAIMGYGDYVIGDNVISRVYYVEGLRHNLFSVGPMRVQTINRKKYILVIVDDYSRFTWVKFLRSKDETPEFVIKFLKQIQVGLNKTVRHIRTDNGTEFVNQTLTEYYESIVPRTPQQNGIVERWNRTLVEAARTMLIFFKALMFLWAEAVATACYTKNQSLIHTHHNKTPYELVHDKKPDLTFL